MTQYREWPDEDKQALAKRVANELQDDSVTRRELLTMLGVVGVGSAVGGAGVNSAVGTASAGTSQSGTIGTASNPVDVEGEDINATAVNTDEVYTVPAGTPADIDTACSNYDVVILQQGATYSGSTTITVPNETKVIAYGATVDYTGTAEAIVIDGATGQNPRPRPMWFGGTISGNIDADAGIVVRDTYGSVVRDVEIESFDGSGTGRGDGYVIENVDAFSEENALHNFSISDCNRGINFRPASVTGGTGTNSFKATKIRDGHIQAGVSGGYGLYCDGAVYDSDIESIGMNVADNVTCVSCGGGMGNTAIENIGGEAQGSTGVTTIELRSFTGALPGIENVTCGGEATHLSDPNNNISNLGGKKDEKQRQIIGPNGNLVLSSGQSGLNGANVWLDTGNDEIRFSDLAGFNKHVVAFKGNNAIDNLSGVSGEWTGQTRLDDGTNTPSGDPALCVWNGSAWRVQGTTTTFT